jgi:hypothetical protein
MGHKRIRIDLPDLYHALSLVQIINREGYVQHEIALLQYLQDDKGYTIVGDPIFINDLQEMFDIIDYAMVGNYNIFLDTIDIVLDDAVQLELIVNNTRDTD